MPPKPERVIRKATESDVFTAEEVELLKQILKAYHGWLAFGKFSKILIIILGTIAAAISAYDIIIARIRQWLTGH